MANGYNSNGMPAGRTMSSNQNRSRTVGGRTSNTAQRSRLRAQRRREVVGLNRRRRAATSAAATQQQIRRRNLTGVQSAGPSARGRNSSLQVSRGFKKKYAISESEGYATVRTGKGNYSQIVKKTGAALNRGQKGLRK